MNHSHDLMLKKNRSQPSKTVSIFMKPSKSPPTHYLVPSDSVSKTLPIVRFFRNYLKTLVFSLWFGQAKGNLGIEVNYQKSSIPISASLISVNCKKVVIIIINLRGQDQSECSLHAPLKSVNTHKPIEFSSRQPEVRSSA